MVMGVENTVPMIYSHICATRYKNHKGFQEVDEVDNIVLRIILDT